MNKKTNQMLLLFMAFVVFSIFSVACFSAPGDLLNIGNIGGIGNDKATAVDSYLNGEFVIVGHGTGASFGTGDFLGLQGKGGIDSIFAVLGPDEFGTIGINFAHNVGGLGDDYLNTVVTFSDGGIECFGQSTVASWDNGDYNTFGYSNPGASFPTEVYSYGDYNSGLTANGDRRPGASYNQFASSGRDWDTSALYIAYHDDNDAGFVASSPEYGSNNADFKSGGGASAFYGVSAASYNYGAAVGYVSAAAIADVKSDWYGLTAKGNDDAVIVKVIACNPDDPWGYPVAGFVNFGGPGNDCFNKVAGYADDTAVAVGYSAAASFNAFGDWYGVAAKGTQDAIIVKYDTYGNVLWAKNFGGTGINEFTDIKATIDGGFVVVGYFNGTYNFEGLTGKGGTDAIIIRFDPDGNVLWAKNFGGAGNDCFNSVTIQEDGSLLTVGYSDESSIGASGDLASLTSQGGIDIIYAIYKDIDIFKVLLLTYANNKDVIYEQEMIPSGGIPISPRTNPTRYGFDFDGWYANEKCTVPFDFGAPVTADTYVYPKWLPVGDDVTVTYNPGSGSIPLTVHYGYKATVVADDTGTPFHHWEDSNGNIRSYDQTYSFVAMEDITLTAVFGAGAVPEPTVNIDSSFIVTPKVFPDKYGWYIEGVDLSFFGDIVVPSSYTIIERGFLGGYIMDYEFDATGTPDIDFTLNNLSSSGGKLVKVRIPGDKTKVQATFLNVYQSYYYTYAARAYLIYEDGANQYIIYSPDIISYYSENFKQNPVYNNW